MKKSSFYYKIFQQEKISTEFGTTETNKLDYFQLL